MEKFYFLTPDKSVTQHLFSSHSIFIKYAKLKYLRPSQKYEFEIHGNNPQIHKIYGKMNVLSSWGSHYIAIRWLKNRANTSEPFFLDKTLSAQIIEQFIIFNIHFFGKLYVLESMCFWLNLLLLRTFHGNFLYIRDIKFHIITWFFHFFLLLEDTAFNRNVIISETLETDGDWQSIHFAIMNANEKVNWKRRYRIRSRWSDFNVSKSNQFHACRE